MRLMPAVPLLSLLGLSLVLACGDGAGPTDAMQPAFKAVGRGGFGFNGSVRGSSGRRGHRAGRPAHP